MNYLLILTLLTAEQQIPATTVRFEVKKDRIHIEAIGVTPTPNWTKARLVPEHNAAVTRDGYVDFWLVARTPDNWIPSPEPTPITALYTRLSPDLKKIKAVRIRQPDGQLLVIGILKEGEK